MSSVLMIIPEYDVIIAGGGPAGSTVATLIAQRGYRVMLFERERFPRFHVGESLLPETYWILKRLNMLPKMRQSRFVKTHGVRFADAHGRQAASFDFQDHRPHESSQTWQVVRSEFDLMMLNNAREHGAEAYEGVDVLDVLFEGDKAVGARIDDADGSRREVRARVIVDASGQATLLQHRFNLRLWDPALNTGAIWAYWRGAHRDDGRDDGAALVLQAGDAPGWFWSVPLHDDVTSVGVVAPFDRLLQGRDNHERTYADAIARTPALQARLAQAHRGTGCFVTHDYSYRSRQVAGDGWVLVGDAFGFVDPLHASGVMLALKSGELAADAICEGLQSGDLSAAQLGRWGAGFNEGVDRLRRLVCEYYDGLDVAAFLSQYPELRGAMTDLLIGDLFTNRVDALWGPMAALHAPGQAPAPRWDTGAAPQQASERAHELVLPAGPKP